MGIKGFGNWGIPILYGVWALGEAWYQLMRFGVWGDPDISWDDGIWAVMEANISTENGIGNWGTPISVGIKGFGDWGDPNVGTDKRIWAPWDPAVASENGIEGLWGPQHSDKGVWEPGDPRIGSWATEDPNIS